MNQIGAWVVAGTGAGCNSKTNHQSTKATVQEYAETVFVIGIHKHLFCKSSRFQVRWGRPAPILIRSGPVDVITDATE